MMMEALAAMGKEIRPATSYDEATPVAEVMEKLEDAYRQGDLERSIHWTDRCTVLKLSGRFYCTP